MFTALSRLPADLPWSWHGARAGKAIAGSPFMCHVGAGDVDAGNSRLFGPGLAAVQLGRDSQLFCELADAFGNKVASAAANGTDLKVGERTGRVCFYRKLGCRGFG